MSHHWQTTEFLYDEKLTLLLFRHILALFPGFEHNWQEITLDCSTFTGRPERGSRLSGTDTYWHRVRVFYKFDGLKFRFLSHTLIFSIRYVLLYDISNNLLSGYL